MSAAFSITGASRAPVPSPSPAFRAFRPQSSVLRSALSALGRPSSVVCPPSAPRRGFTLIELLTVIAILGILASIAITVGRGVQQRAKIARAKAEMAIIAAALEQYKAQYGDYPWTPDDTGLGALPYSGVTGGQVLFNALCGNIAPNGNLLATKGRTLISLSQFKLWSNDASKLPDETSATPVILNNWIEDPWSDDYPAPGKWYWYSYKTGSNWKNPGFLLYSHGPDGACVPGTEESTGLVADVLADPSNADNIYFGRN